MRIVSDVQHPSSWQKIQQLEAPKPAAPDEPNKVHPAPQFAQQLQSVDGRIEGQSVHFDAKVPKSDLQIRN